MERQIMICECNSLEHQVIFWHDEEDGDLYCEPHLATHRNFFKRLCHGLMYTFGYKSRFGDWDSTIFKKEDLNKLRAYLDKINKYNNMKAIKDPKQETYGMCYSPRFTDEFEKLIESARAKIEPFSKKEISQWTYYFKVKGEEVSGEFDCCDDEKCIKQTKAAIRKQYGKGTHVEEVYYDNDGDHDDIEICCQCGKPLNDWLTWCDSVLEYIEQYKPWNVQFLKDEAFLIHCIFQSSPTMDCFISEYAKNNSDRLKSALESREEFFQRIGNLAQCVLKADFAIKIIK